MNVLIKSKSLGLLNATVSPNFMSLDIEGYGKVDLNSSVRDLNDFNAHSFTLYAKAANAPVFLEALAKRGIVAKPDYTNCFQFAIDKEASAVIKGYYLQKVREIETNFLNSVYKLTISEVGCDHVYPSVIFTEDLPIDLNYHLLKKYGLDGSVLRKDFYNKDLLDKDATIVLVEYAKSFLTEEKLYELAYEQAKKTGERILLKKTVLHESETPLAKDGEDDMVDELVFVNTEGKLEIEYVHNY